MDPVSRIKQCSSLRNGLFPTEHESAYSDVAIPVLYALVRKILTAAVCVGIVTIVVAPTRQAAASHASGAAAFLVDMDPLASPANSATSLGTRETCGTIMLNGVQDADEDAIDAVDIDVTANGIPPATGMAGYGYSISYSESHLTVQSVQGGFLLAANQGSSVMDVTDLLPDTDMNGRWSGGELDTETGESVPESGSGVLQRIRIGADTGSAAGVYDLVLSNAGHIDQENEAYAPDTLENARLAVNVACPPADTDGDGVYDVDEVQCGSDPYDTVPPLSRPERIDGIFAGTDDDEDTLIDEALPGDIPMADCDGDGFTGTAENLVYAPSIQGDQDPCGTAPSSPPFNVPIGWPADLKTGGIPDSTNRINLLDLTSFLSPVRRLDTSPGDPGYDPRWDVVPGNSGQAKDINSADYSYVLYFTAAMLNGARAYGGPACPWPP